MRGLPRIAISALAALLAGLVVLPMQAQAACDDQYPSCLRPNPQNVQEQTSADDAQAADIDAAPSRAASRRGNRKSHRTAERRPARSPAPAPAPVRIEKPAMRDPAPATIARLPWWQGDPAQTQAEPAEETSVQAAAGAWMALAPRNSDTSTPSPDMPESTADQVLVADASEVNELDLAAADVPEAPDTSWLNGLLAVLGGALAAGSAARLLLV
jgi:hypothetical protein